MKVGFAGTPGFAVTVLTALLEAELAVALVLTQPDRPRGRGLEREPSPVKAFALARGLRLMQPPTLGDEAARESLFATDIDVLVVAAYGLLLPPAVLAWPCHGCLNVHASLLPRWRGAAPIQRALLAGDALSGATIMQMDAGLDTGPSVDAVRVPIDPRETAGTLERKLAAAGARALVATLRRLAAGDSVLRTPQPATGATYAPKIVKTEALIDWNNDVATLDRQIRAFNPSPGASTSLGGGRLKLWRAEPDAVAVRDAAPGTLLEASRDGILVACGVGCLRLFELQPAGGRRMNAAAFVAGHALVPGGHFGENACRKPRT